MASEEIAKELADTQLEAGEDVVTPWVSENQKLFRHQFLILDSWTIFE
jgi:hypothetical protein